MFFLIMYLLSGFGKKNKKTEFKVVQKPLFFFKNSYKYFENPSNIDIDIKKLNFLLSQAKQLKEEDIPLIIQHWVRTLKIKLGWIPDFDQIIVKYAINIFIFDIFRSSSKLLETFTGHIKRVNSIDYSIFESKQLLCSGSDDKTVCVWDVDNNKQIQSFNGHSSHVYCVKFSQTIIITIIRMSFVLHQKTKPF
ncbi:F-box and wd40 domain protein, partial [Reticulomyxa filosa]